MDARAALLLGNVDRDASQWQRAVLASGGYVGSTQLALVSALIRNLKQGGVWSSLDRLWIFASENSTQALTDVVARASATATNSPTFTASRGYAGNGSSQYIDTNFNASSAGGLYTQNSAHLSVWVETAQNTNARVCYIGNDFGATFSLIGQLNNTTGEMGLQGSGSMGAAFGTRTGFWCVRRSASNASATFQNAVSFATTATASNAIPNANVTVLCNNTVGTKSNYSDGRTASASIGGVLNDAQQTAFYAAMRAYMTAVGVA
jgi:hypothetical protein